MIYFVNTSLSQWRLVNYKDKKILIVEANDVNAHAMSELYLNSGYKTVETVSSVSECFTTITTSEFDLLVVGRLNKGELTIDFLQHIREQFSKNSLVILCLLEADDACISKLVGLGVQEYIIKPVSSKELLLRSKVQLSQIHEESDAAYMAFEENKMAAVGEMISMIAHQWRQPLSSMGAAIARIEIDLLTETINNEELKSTCNDMKTTIGYLSETIDDFRYFFTPSKEKEETTLQEIVSRTESVISISLAHNRITLIVDEPLVETPLLLYVSEVVQVLINMLNNATDELIDRKISGPCIWISSAKIGNYVTLSIRDNAGGIKDDVLPKVFDPYFSTKKKKNGSGLGLYMAKNIIERHCDGTISVRNSDEGAEFMIKIPIETT